VKTRENMAERVHVRLPPLLARRLKTAAVLADRTPAEEVREILRRELFGKWGAVADEDGKNTR